MIDDWPGFTESEIRAIGGNRKFNIVSDPKISIKNGVAVAKQSTRDSQRRFIKKNVVRDRMLNGDKKPNYNITNQSIPKDARLFIPQIPEEEEDEVEAAEAATTVAPPVIPEEEKKKKAITEKKEEKIQAQHHIPILKSHSIEISASKLLASEGTGDCGEAEEEVPIIPDIDALTKFQEKQKMMEEHNRQRKELLQKALADRTKKTREEAKRLNQIEEELKRLDAMLSNDVSIIRDQIEAASHDFMEAQKRYDKAEREFLEAKLCLFSHKERKELLTSHLCTIIEQNEIRKAKKLSDLMEKLQLASSAEPKPPPPQPKREGPESE